MTSFSTVDEYIGSFPKETAEKLEALRQFIKSLAPEASEKISYQIPTFFLQGNLIHFAAYKRHLGLYPGAEGVQAFAQELGPYVHSKGTIQFPLDTDLPWDLIRRIVEHRIEKQKEKRN